MNKKRTYIQPSMSVVVIKARFQLLSMSNRFVDDPDYEWDEEGAN